MNRARKEDYNVARLIHEMEHGIIDYNHSFQRGRVWTNEKNSHWIRSVITGDAAISSMVLNQVGKNKKEGFDGKQRGYATYEFAKGFYRLHKNTEPIIDDNGNKVDIARCKYEDIEKLKGSGIKERFDSAGLLVYSYDNLTREEKRILFRNINNGTKASKADLARIDIESRSTLINLCSHKAIKEAVTEINRNKYLDLDVMADAWIISFLPSPSLYHTERAKILSTTKVTTNQESQLYRALDYIFALFVHNGLDKAFLSKLRGKTSLTMLIYAAVQADKEKMERKDFVDKMIHFFSSADGVTVSEKYNLTVKEGSSKPEKVRVRMDEVNKVLA